MRRSFPDDAEVAHASRHADRYRNINAGALGSGMAVDWSDKLGSLAKPYNHAKDRYFTHQWGSSW